jgi:transcriptional regulator with PAS, ATPase and Fis domain
VFWDGGSVSQLLPPRAELTVGRAEECDVVVRDDSVSRRHAIVRAGTPPTIEDVGSANGTRVGGDLLPAGTRAALAPATVVELGDTLLVVRAAEAEESGARKDGPVRVDPATARLDDLVATVAPADIPVLLLGETGVGKGVTAEAIHRQSKHAAGRFVRVNCAALADALLESELFGHERGAFTGAVQAKPGLVEAASGGTLLLDEVGDMPLATQAKLLHVLEHGEVLRVGALTPRPVDVRFVAATNRDLEARVADGRFRQDLYYRLNGVSITIPPLRERSSEIAGLAASFVDEACARMGRPLLGMTDAALDLLTRHDWPGNVRELRNAVLRAALFARGDRIGVEHFDLPAGPERLASGGVLRGDVRDLERRRIVEALARSGDNLSETARTLGIARGTLRSRMKELGLVTPSPSRRR